MFEAQGDWRDNVDTVESVEVDAIVKATIVVASEAVNFDSESREKLEERAHEGGRVLGTRLEEIAECENDGWILELHYGCETALELLKRNVEGGYAAKVDVCYDDGFHVVQEHVRKRVECHLGRDQAESPSGRAGSHGKI